MTFFALHEIIKPSMRGLHAVQIFLNDVKAEEIFFEVICPDPVKIVYPEVEPYQEPPDPLVP